MSSSDWSVSGSASAHRLGGLVLAAAGEDGERTEEPLLLGLEQVVRPLDGRPERLLPRIRVPARLEQVEPLRQPLDELLRREHDGARGGQLERQRQVVQPRAELRDRVGVPRPPTERRARVRKSSTPSCVRERRDRVHVLALELEPLAARDEQRRAVDVAERGDPVIAISGMRCSALSRIRSARFPCSRAATPSASSRPGCSSTSSACATDAASRCASWSDESGTHQMPSGNASAASAAACIASLVLPVPPGPVSVNSRAVASQRGRRSRRARARGRGTPSPARGGSSDTATSVRGTTRLRAGRRARERRGP